jgi:hypothetical protein
LAIPRTGTRAACIGRERYAMPEAL